MHPSCTLYIQRLGLNRTSASPCPIMAMRTGDGMAFLGHDDMICFSQCHRHALCMANRGASLHGPWIKARCSYRQSCLIQLNDNTHGNGEMTALMAHSNRQVPVMDGNRTRILCQCSSIALYADAAHRQTITSSHIWPGGIACRGDKFDGDLPWCLRLLCPKCATFPARVLCITTSARNLQISSEDTPLCFECASRMCSSCEDEMDDKAFAICTTAGCNRPMCFSCMKWLPYNSPLRGKRMYKPVCAPHGNPLDSNSDILNLMNNGTLHRITCDASNSAFGTRWLSGRGYQRTYDAP